MDSSYMHLTPLSLIKAFSATCCNFQKTKFSCFIMVWLYTLSSLTNISVTMNLYSSMIGERFQSKFAWSSFHSKKLLTMPLVNEKGDKQLCTYLRVGDSTQVLYVFEKKTRSHRPLLHHCYTHRCMYHNKRQVPYNLLQLFNYFQI